MTSFLCSKVRLMISKSVYLLFKKVLPLRILRYMTMTDILKTKNLKFCALVIFYLINLTIYILNTETKSLSNFLSLLGSQNSSSQTNTLQEMRRDFLRKIWSVKKKKKDQKILTLSVSKKIGPSQTTYRASLVTQTVKNLPVIQETQVWPLGQEDPQEKGMATTPVLLPREFHG